MKPIVRSPVPAVLTLSLGLGLALLISPGLSAQESPATDSAEPTGPEAVGDHPNREPRSPLDRLDLPPSPEAPTRDGITPARIEPESPMVIDISRREAITVAQRLAQYYQARVPLPPVLAPLGYLDATPNMDDALYLRDALVNQLTPPLGRIVGYKAGLTSPPVQARFGVDHPLRGILLSAMLLESGATVPANVGARPLVEADLMVRVGSVAINHATTREEAIAALDAVIPFIELPDLLLEPDLQPTAADLVAINVGARSGVMGTPIPLTPRQDGRSWLEVLGDTPVEMVNNATGDAIAQGNTQALLGHPLDAVLWLVEDLQAAGQWLHIGDVLSLGSITMPLPLEPNQTIELQYHNLSPDGSTATVSVTVAPL